MLSPIPKILMGGAAAVAVLDVPAISGWEKLGIVGLLMAGVIVLYLDGRKHQDKLVKIIENNTAASVAIASKMEGVEKIQVEVKDAVRLCPGWKAAQEARKQAKE